VYWATRVSMAKVKEEQAWKAEDKESKRRRDEGETGGTADEGMRNN